MKHLFIGAIFLLGILACGDDDNDVETTIEGYFAVANRGDGTVTIYESDDLELETTITLPDGAQPTYVVQSPETGYLYISDLSTQKVWVYDSKTFASVTSYDIEMGGFHMWVNDTIDQLWVTNIISKTTSVINTQTGATLATIPMEAEGITFPNGAATHDVFISPDGQYAYVSIASLNGQNYVTQYSTSTFEEVKTVEVGGDPHFSGNSSNLYVLTQFDSNVTEFTYDTFTATGQSIMINNAHGVTHAGGDQFFITNFNDFEIVSYDAGSNTVLNTASTQAMAGKTHNVAYSAEDNVVSATISGGTTVEFFDVSDPSNMTLINSVTSGTNPFGVWYYTVEE